jgi:hypothetical protein
MGVFQGECLAKKNPFHYKLYLAVGFGSQLQHLSLQVRLVGSITGASPDEGTFSSAAGRSIPEYPG